MEHDSLFLEIILYQMWIFFGFVIPEEVPFSLLRHPPRIHRQSKSVPCISGNALAPGVVSCMMTSSNGNIFRVTGHLCGEFTGPR